MNTYKYFLSLIITILALLTPQVTFAESFQSLAFPSTVHNGSIMYYDEYLGEVVSFDIETSEKTPILQLPGGKFRLEAGDDAVFDDMPGPIYFSPDLSHMIIYAPTTSPESYSGDYPFALDQVDESKRWWIYTFETGKSTVLSSDFTHVGWNSLDELIYVYQDQEVAVAPIDRLSEFRVLEDQFDGGANISQPIIANSERYIIPTTTGYSIDNRGLKSSYATESFTQISANPTTENIFIYGENSIDIINWSGEIIGELDNLKSVDSIIPLDDNRLLILLLDGSLIIYSSDGQNTPVLINQEPVTKIAALDPTTPENVLIGQNENVFIYNLAQNRIQTSIIQDPESPIEISDGSNLERVSSTSVPPLFIAGTIILFVASIGFGFILWKKRKNSY